MFICGSGSFSRQEEDDTDQSWSPCSTPKRSKKGISLFRTKDSKNPYADRGLDKFYALLADHDEKRQKIYTENGSEDISFVRFVYSNSNDVKPIVVKVKDKKQSGIKTPPATNNSESSDKKNTIETANVSSERLQTAKEESNTKQKHRCLACRNFKLENLRKPYYYFPVIIVLILIFLAVYGRSFAILCTSIGWYLIPTIKGETSSSSASRKPKRKKEYARKMSENKTVNEGVVSSPRSVINGLSADHKSPRQHGHRRSW